jgi:hypothetical protein
MLCLALAACGGALGAPVDDSAVYPAYFVAGVDHRWFPIEPGRVWVYEGVDDGLPKREEVRTLDEHRLIAGVSCTAIEETGFLDDELVDRTTEWFAQDHRGNVWKFGEESFEADGGIMVRTDDSWVAGVAGARPWLAFPADPAVGARYVGYRPGGQDVHMVASTTSTADVPAGVFLGCLEIVENPDDPDDSDIILYGPGVGRVSEVNSSGYVELVSVLPE